MTISIEMVFMAGVTGLVSLVLFFVKKSFGEFGQQLKDMATDMKVMVASTFKLEGAQALLMQRVDAIEEQNLASQLQGLLLRVAALEAKNHK